MAEGHQWTFFRRKHGISPTLTRGHFIADVWAGKKALLQSMPRGYQLAQMKTAPAVGGDVVLRQFGHQRRWRNLAEDPVYRKMESATAGEVKAIAAASMYSQWVAAKVYGQCAMASACTVPLRACLPAICVTNLTLSRWQPQLFQHGTRY